jgi:hypothetical protein
MLTPFWFRTNIGLGYGVTAESLQEAQSLLSALGYPKAGEIILESIPGIKFSDLEESHVAPNAGTLVVRGVWFPRHNL